MLVDLKLYVVSALVSAAIWTLPAAAISLIYGVLKYPNFAIPEFMTLGAYLALLLCNLSLPFWAAAFLAVILTGIVALAVDQTVFRLVRSAGALPPILLSLGLMLALQNVVRFVWGNDALQYPLVLQRPWRLAGFVFTPSQLTMIGVVLLVLAIVFVALGFTRFGRAIRATSTNPELAVVTGVGLETVYAGVIFASGAFAAIGGIVLATETTLTPLLGARLLIPLFAVGILGGLGSIAGAAIAAVLLAAVSEFSLFFLPPTYKTALAFLVLALVLMLRPSGIVKMGN